MVKGSGSKSVAGFEAKRRVGVGGGNTMSSWDRGRNVWEHVLDAAGDMVVALSEIVAEVLGSV